MTLEEKDRQNLINYRLNQAEETISDVELLIENERFRSAVNRIYYGMFYSLLALGLANQFETSKHGQLIGWFNENFIHKDKINSKYGKIINKAFNRRTKGDYDVFIEFDKEIVTEMLAEMKEFIKSRDKNPCLKRNIIFDYVILVLHFNFDFSRLHFFLLGQSKR